MEDDSELMKKSLNRLRQIDELLKTSLHTERRTTLIEEKNGINDRMPMIKEKRENFKKDLIELLAAQQQIQNQYFNAPNLIQPANRLPSLTVS